MARDNLGELSAQVAGAALLTDYVLTVAVSVSSGVAQIASAVPGLFTYRVPIAVGVILAIMVVNLRGMRESGAVFAVPTYLFLVTIGTAMLIGLYRYFAGTLGVVRDPPPIAHHGPLQALSLFLFLHAFSSGTTALTGMEAISNGVTAFREPRSAQRRGDAGVDGVLVAGLFLGMTFLAVHARVIPGETETVISQLARTVFGGRGPAYLLAVGATTLILFLAANTAFNGFPRLGALQAADGFLPRQLTYRGSRLVYSRGIVVLAVTASALIVAFQASVTALIPLYASAYSCRSRCRRPA